MHYPKGYYMKAWIFDMLNAKFRVPLCTYLYI
jgi:hypothetical protein